MRPPVPPVRADQPAGWVVALASAYCLTFGPSAILVTGFGAFVRPLAGSFGWSPASIAFAVTLLSLVIMVVSVVQGVLIDRWGARRLILWSVPAFAAGLAAMAWLPGRIGIFYAAFVALPVLGIGVWPVSYMKLTGSWFVRRLGLALGTANAGIGLGAMTVTPIAVWIIDAHGWRTAYVALALLALTTLPVAALFVRSAEPFGVVPADVDEPAAAMPWRDPMLATVVVGYLLVGITGTGLLTNLLPMLLEAGLRQREAITALSLFGATSLAGRFVSGFLLDRFAARGVLLTFTALSAAGLIALASGAAGTSLFAVVVAFGMLSGGEFDILAYCVRRYFGMRLFGRIYGAAFSAFQLGAAAGAAGLAMSLAATGSYRVGLYAMAATQLLALVAFARLGAYRYR